MSAAEPMDQPPADPNNNPWRYAALGTQLAAAVLAGAGLGYWVDGRWGTAPWSMVGGAALGATVGFYEFFVEVLGARKKK